MTYQNKLYIPKITRRILTFDLEGYRDFRNDRMNAYLCGVWDNKTFYPIVENREVYKSLLHSGESSGVLDKQNTYPLFAHDRCMKTFVDTFITQKYKGSIFYAHFGSIFDFPILLQELQERPDLNIYPITKGSKIIKLIIQDDNEHRWYFHDSSALLNFSLDELTKTFKVGHKKLEVVRKDSNYDRKLYGLYKSNPKLVIEYLKHDCIGLYEILDEFKRKMLEIGGDLGLTIASTSLKTFKHGYQKNILYMCDKDVNDEMRNAYFGGKTLIYRMYAPDLKDEYYYYYDCNSLYPFCMSKYPYPVSKPNIIMTPPKNIYMENEGITKATIISPEKMYDPVLPSKIKMKTDTKLMFVLGKQDGYWDNAFLRKAKELGYLIEPEKSYIFKTDYIFKGFVKHFYDIKEHSDSGTPMYLIAKLLMNSLYGRFGMRQDAEFMIKDPNPDENEYEIIDYVDLDTGWTRVKQESKGKYFLPQIAIHVTTMAQLYLYEATEKILEKGYKVFYEDSVRDTTPILIRKNNVVSLIQIKDIGKFYEHASRQLITDTEIYTSNGFSKIKYVYKHSVSKQMYRIFTRKGFIEVSEDHSLIINNKIISPKDLTTGNKIELIKYPKIDEVSFDNDISELLGFFLAEGACGSYTTKWGIKNTWAINNQDIRLLKKYQRYLLKIGFYSKILNTMKSSNTYKLIILGDIKLAVDLFKKWCYTKNNQKTIPSFILSGDKNTKTRFLFGYFLGDGSIKNKEKITCFTSKDKCLTYGVCMLLDSLGYDYSIGIRKDKLEIINIRIIRNKLDKRIRKKNRIIKIIPFKIIGNKGEYIYDIETDNHSFCGGIGNINLHNTDSITTDYKNFPASKKLGDWKLEKRLSSGIFILPKTYKMTDDKGKIEIRAKGYNKNLREKISPGAFEKSLHRNDNSGFDVVSDKKEMLRPLASFHRFKEFNHLDYIRRSLQTKYNKRKILKDFNTIPFDIDELIK